MVPGTGALPCESRVELNLVTPTNPIPPWSERRPGTDVVYNCSNCKRAFSTSQALGAPKCTQTRTSGGYRFGRGYTRTAMMNHPQLILGGRFGVNNGGFAVPVPSSSSGINGIGSVVSFANNSQVDGAVNRPAAGSDENKDSSGIDLTLKL
ncbi:hypothetical protein F3Y22_tig00110332pilonHSYRG00725 [Hibiscus syriacus]|uniref:Uncharacterized protein n=1 Tax=Hibiscus syriacus TaxID=106335 RepID=A0A6A3B009_HIBSY|nr:hypothetical protein F3Y22_tig00110332pilonHSYRG00725 [Hibiscus syriacus]